MYELRGRDEQFKADWDDAVEQGTDALEDAAVQRAIKEKSDTMIISLLKSRRKENMPNVKNIPARTVSLLLYSNR